MSNFHSNFERMSLISSMARLLRAIRLAKGPPNERRSSKQLTVVPSKPYYPTRMADWRPSHPYSLDPATAPD